MVPRQPQLPPLPLGSTHSSPSATRRPGSRRCRAAPHAAPQTGPVASRPPPQGPPSRRRAALLVPFGAPELQLGAHPMPANLLGPRPSALYSALSGAGTARFRARLPSAPRCLVPDTRRQDRTARELGRAPPRAQSPLPARPAPRLPEPQLTPPSSPHCR